MLAASAMAGEELYYHGKNYIMSLFMESIYMHQKYWQHLKHIDLGEFPLHWHSDTDSDRLVVKVCTVSVRLGGGREPD